jgi:hypothetical protein
MASFGMLNWLFWRQIQRPKLRERGHLITLFNKSEHLIWSDPIQTTGLFTAMISMLKTTVYSRKTPISGKLILN